jgi:arabinan endo-1,5-alpha-L-arabinosidase
VLRQDGLSAAGPGQADGSNTPGTLPQQAQRWRQFVHDPSTLTKWGSEYWIFSTGPGIASRHSHDLKNWENGPRIFSTPPAWTTNAVPKFKGYFWAPDVLHLGNRYLVYYSVSSWGVNTSAIGLVTNPTLDPTDPAYAWTDQGLVCQSRAEDSFNAIDPSVMRDVDGTLWLAFGSFWSGIKLIELDPATGKRVAPNSPMYSLAHHDPIEAACLSRHGGYYFLFVNWGFCCRGTNSTYNIRVGRSARITGPYLDLDGKDLAQGGGTLFLGSEGAFIGPGHAGIFEDGGHDWLSCHFYDGQRGGAAVLSVQRLAWTPDGWPVARTNSTTNTPN